MMTIVNTGNIKAENKKISDDFINLITDMFGVIDEVSEKIGDGKYLELANQFKKLSEFKEKMGTNVVYIEHEKRTQMRVLKPKERRLTYAEKLKDKNYYKCHKCDCVLTKKEKPNHEKTKKCKKIYASRMITLAKKKKVNSDKLIILDDMLDTRRGKYMKEYQDEGLVKTEKRSIFTLQDYYSDDTENAVKVLQRRYRIKKGDVKLLTKEEQKKRIELWQFKFKWHDIRGLKKRLNDDKAFKTQRLKVQSTHGFQIKGVNKMTNREQMEMCVRALFISTQQKNRPKLKGIKWIDSL